MLKNLMPIVAACLLLLLVWASAIPLYHWFESDQEPDPVTANLEKWQNHGIDSYEFVVQKHCDCAPPGNIPVKSVVRDSLNIAAFDNRMVYDPSQPRVEGVPRTILELFGLLQHTEDGSSVTSVAYNSLYGFPSSIVIDSSSQQVTYTVADFNVISDIQ